MVLENQSNFETALTLILGQLHKILQCNQLFLNNLSLQSSVSNNPSVQPGVSNNLSLQPVVSDNPSVQPVVFK